MAQVILLLRVVPLLLGRNDGRPSAIGKRSATITLETSSCTHGRDASGLANSAGAVFLDTRTSRHLHAIPPVIISLQEHMGSRVLD